MTIKIIPNEKGNPVGKLAEAELFFTSGALEGLRLIGFAIWDSAANGNRRVTYPARQYSVNGERRSFSLLRPAADSEGQARLTQLILDAYDAWAKTALEESMLVATPEVQLTAAQIAAKAYE